MDNNFDNYGQTPQRPRKRVTKQMLRRRQFCGLAGIAFVVLLFIVLIAKGCSNTGGKGKEDETATTTTAAATTTVTYATTTTPTTTLNPLAAQVKLDRHTLYLDIGETGVAIIQSYPTGSGEPNEVWTSGDETIAKVNELGYVTGMSAGETYITLSFDNNPGVEIQIKVVVADGGTTAPKITAGTSTTPATVSFTTVDEEFLKSVSSR